MTSVGSKSLLLYSPKFILHDLLKAQAMRFRKPTQIIRPSTYDERKTTQHLKQHLREQKTGSR